MDFWTLQVPLPLALAVVATVGYLFGRRNRNTSTDTSLQSSRELRRAQTVASELEKIALDVRRSLARHHASVVRFKDRVAKLSEQQAEACWKDLCGEAEAILRPTLQLATQLANAYDEIRQQGSNLMTFSEARTDPLTGVNNRRGLEDAIGAHFATMIRYETPFSLAIFDIDHFKRVNDERGHLYGDGVLQQLARLFDEALRETDILARYGGEEFVVIMPQTDLNGASVFSERLRAEVEQQLPVTVSGGVAEAIDGDTRDSLLARADTAMHCAKSAGHNCIFRHDGEKSESVVEELTPTEAL